MNAATTRSGAGVWLRHQEKFVYRIELHIGAAEKLLSCAGERFCKSSLRREIIKLDTEINLCRRAGGAVGGINARPFTSPSPTPVNLVKVPVVRSTVASLPETN